jgi:RNA polymerase sigma factor (sigma-70 family)
LPDEVLLRRFVGHRDEAAFEALVWRHGPLVLGVSRRVLGRTPDAEDAFQATFLVLARKAGSIRRGMAVGPWLYRVAYRVALRARGRAAQSGRTQPLPDDLVAPASPDDVERLDLRCVLDDEVQRLPAKYREPVILRYLEGLSTAEVAGVLGCPPGTVLSRLAWARQRLRTRLAARGVALSAAVAVAATTGREAGAVPVRWVAATAGAALRFAAGGRSGVGFTRSAVLAEGVLRAMWMTKLQVGAVLALGVLVTGASLMLPAQSPDKPEVPAQGAPPAEVTVSRPVRREVASYEDFPGRIEAAMSVDIRPRVTGLLEKVAFRPGTEVKRGDLLFELDPRPYQADCAKAEAELMRAEARLRRVEADFARVKTLQSTGVVSRDELDRLTAEQAETAAGLRVARAGLERTKFDLDATRIALAVPCWTRATSPVPQRLWRPLSRRTRCTPISTCPKAAFRACESSCKRPRGNRVAWPCWASARNRTSRAAVAWSSWTTASIRRPAPSASAQCFQTRPGS